MIVTVIDFTYVFFMFFIYIVSFYYFFFFFQAEDGIRDWSVTGVQTCALPIFKIKCMSNQKQIGIAYKLYADDHIDFYPIHDGWASVGGKYWTNANVSGNAADYGGRVPETNRPLNRYIGAVEVFHCPADHGDALNTQVKTCWEGWGNSYLVEWSADAFRVEKVTGDSKAARGTPQATPNKESRFALRPVTKVIQGDWPWHANRSSTDKRTVWHNYKGKRYEDMLFGDSHVENYRFPKEMDGWISTLPDMNFNWW